jgi:SAM-dependent methyltransferase
VALEDREATMSIPNQPDGPYDNHDNSHSSHCERGHGDTHPEGVQFDREYWENHWSERGEERDLPVNPYLPLETAELPVGSALDAGCGEGTEAIWLADRGWQVTGVDISASALTVAERRSVARGLDADISWVEADITRWHPARTWDLVVSSYAHAEIGQLALYRLLSGFVAPGGDLLIVGHLLTGADHGHPVGVTVLPEDIAELFTGMGWTVEASYRHIRTVWPGDQPVQLQDAVVRVRRRG